jgi:hypothetical protein
MMPGERLTNMEMFDRIREQDSDVMNFELKREPTPDRTFSAEGLDDLMSGIAAFVAGRVSHHLAKRAPGEPGPSKMAVEVKVGIDGESWQVVSEDEMPWYATIDGSRRGKGLSDG